MSQPTSTTGSSHNSPNPLLPGGYANSSPNRNHLLFDMSKLQIPQPLREMFKTVNIAVKDYMYGDKYDSSHDYEHIQRVVANAYRIYTGEMTTNPEWASTLNTTVIYLACMTHDVGESKYEDDKNRTQEEIVEEMLTCCGATPELARKVGIIAKTVSYTNERAHPDDVQDVLKSNPELAVVQDADRLDAIGAVGTGRCFAYGGASVARRRQTLHFGIQLHHHRFSNYPEMMKTEYGKEQAREYLETMKRFREEWYEQSDVSNVL